MSAATSAGRPLGNGPAALGAALMMSLPFLLAIHRRPLTSFETESIAMTLGLLCAGAVLLWSRPARMQLPPVALAPLLLGAVVLLQIGLGMPAYAGNALVFCTYLAWSAVLAIAGRHCAGTLGPTSLYSLLAWYVLGAGALSALFGIVQYAGVWPWFGGLIAAPSAVAGEGVYGNLAQQNHYATHVALALASAVYLHGAGQLRRALFIGATLLLAAGLALSASRSVLLYGAWIAVAYALFRAGRLPWRTLGVIAGAGVLLVLGLLAAAHFSLLGPRLARMVAFSGGIGPRSFLWHQAWQIFLANPLLGIGTDRFAHGLIEHLRPGQRNWGIDQYAHNLVLQILALTGAVGAAALLLPLLAFARRVARARLAFDWMWPGAVLGILFIHSMLEQPLHYAYFLGIAAFAAGSMDPASLDFKLAGWGRFVALAAVGVALLGMGMTWRAYDALADNFYGPRAGDVHDAAHDALIRRLHGHPLLQPLTELASPAAFVPPDAALAQRLAFNTRVAGFAPTAEVLLRQTVLLAEAGRADEALRQCERALLAYPGQGPMFFERIAVLARREPERYGLLRRCAQQPAAQAH